LLKRRIPILERLARQEGLHPEVLRLVSKRIERDISTARHPNQGRYRPNAKQGAMAKWLGARQEAIAELLGGRARILWHRILRLIGRHNRPTHKHIRTCYVPMRHDDSRL
ncbi:MAG: hypothetical protein J7M25_04745, partial [Deltaproteobacteria bacterium]|nr:hypothetical protein [Deltaproteobacteria bacterium]